MFLLMLTGLFSLHKISQLNTSTVEISKLTKDFQLALDAFQKEYGFPGATAAFVLQDGTSGVVATGVADVETGILMTVKSRMLSASIGKTFVGATAVALSREGVLDLDAPISRWLGDRQWFTRLPNHDTITLRHLLTHSSGLPDHVHLDSFANEGSRKWPEKDNPFPPEVLIEFVLDLSPLFEVGKGWSYTDTGYILIGLVIEEVTERSYYDEIKERFLTPLGLTLTTPSDRRFLPGLAAGYMAADNAFGFPRKTTTADGAMVWHPGLEWTGGGLVSNSLDLARWGSALFGGNAMSGSYLDELLNSVPISPDIPDIQYGAGVGIYRTGPFGPVYGHGGWIPGYSSSLRYYADHRITIAFQINTDIGIVDGSTPVVREMETHLAKIVISSTRSL
ncbi:MAG: serine hydrolase domain-containing protein [Candidatus Marinimicrobia bacterium]|nr:serine hydrolase domain-containing protein [Candidatus Neomarinimicrobiota bacterium]